MKPFVVTIFFFVNLLFIYDICSAQIPTNGLVAYYPFNSNAYDAIGTNHGSVNGASLTTDRKGISSSAYSFNGANNYIEVPHSASFDISGPITLSVWLNSNSISSQRIIDKTTVSGADAWMIDLRPGGQIRFIVANAATDQPHSNAVYTNTNTWYHFVATYDNSNVKFYKDGVLVNYVSRTGSSVNNTNPLRFGANSLLNGDWFNGKMDDIRIYNRTLSGAEVQQLYQAEAPPIDITTGLVAYYKMDGNAEDASGNNNHGTVQNGLTFSTDRFGNSAQTANFDGIDDYISVNSTATLESPSTAITITNWIKVSNTKLEAYYLAKTDYSTYNYRCGLFNEGMYFGKAGGQTNAYLFNGNNPFPNTTWRMLSYTFDGENVKFYMDGQLVKTINDPASISTSNVPLEIGRDAHGPTEWFKGEIDDIRIYNRALSDSEIQAIYQAEAPPIDITTGLVAHYKMDGNANDVSGNGNHGTAQNGATFGTDRFGNTGKAASFDGIDDFMQATSSQTLTTVTTSFWFKPTNLATQTPIIIGMDDGIGSNPALNGISLYTPSNLVNIIVSDLQMINTGYSFPSANEWYFVSIQQNAGEYKMFVNNTRVFTGNGAVPRPATEIRIGSATNCRFYKGLIDDIRVYNRALTDAEIMALFTLENSSVLNNVKIENLLEPINKSSYQVPRESTIHHYFLAKDNTSGEKLPNVVLTYQIGVDPTVRYSAPSDSSGLIDLNLTVGGANHLISTDDWMTVSNNFIPVQNLGIAFGRITGTNAFANAPFNVKVVNKAEPIARENGISFGLSFDAAGGDFGKTNRILNVDVNDAQGRAAVGVSFGPSITYTKNGNIWDITAGGSIGAFAEVEYSTPKTLGKFTPSINGAFGVSLEPRGKVKFSVDLDKAKDCFKFAKALFNAIGDNEEKYLRVSSFLANVLSISPGNPLSYNGASVGVSISANGSFALGLTSPFDLYNFAGYGHEWKAEAGINFEANGDFIYELEHDWDKPTNTQTFSNTVTSGVSVSGGFTLLNKLTRKEPKNIFSLDSPPLTIVSYSKINSIKFFNKYLYGASSTMTGAGFTISTQEDRNDIISGKTHKINYLNNWEYSKKAVEKIYAGFYLDDSLKYNPLASFITLNKPLGASLVNLNPVKSLTYQGLALNKFVLSKAENNWGQDDVIINQTREISLLTEKEFGFEKLQLAKFNFSSWQTFTHNFIQSGYSKSLKRTLTTVELPNIESNLEIPDSEFFGDLLDKLEYHVNNLVAETYASAYSFYKKEKDVILSAINKFTNRVNGGKPSFIRKSLSGKVLYDSFSKDQTLTSNVPSVFTFTVNPSPQVFTTTTKIDFSYFYPENKLNAITASDTFRIVSDVFELIAKDNASIVTQAPNGSFLINTEFSNTDLQLASLPVNVVPRVLFKPVNTNIWEDIGAVNQDINFNRLGTFSIGVKITNDFIAPDVQVTIPAIFNSPNSILVNVSDNQSGIDWNKNKVWVNGQLVSFTRDGFTNQFTIPISSLPTIPQNVFNVQIVIYDLAGNVKFWENILPCVYSKEINTISATQSNPTTEKAISFINISAKVPQSKTLYLKAGQTIVFNPGFEVSGNVFKAEIGGCAN